MRKEAGNGVDAAQPQIKSMWWGKIPELTPSQSNQVAKINKQNNALLSVCWIKYF